MNDALSSTHDVLCCLPQRDCIKCQLGVGVDKINIYHTKNSHIFIRCIHALHMNFIFHHPFDKYAIFHLFFPYLPPPPVVVIVAFNRKMVSLHLLCLGLDFGYFVFSTYRT